MKVNSKSSKRTHLPHPCHIAMQVDKPQAPLGAGNLVRKTALHYADNLVNNQPSSSIEYNERNEQNKLVDCFIN